MIRAVVGNANRSAGAGLVVHGVPLTGKDLRLSSVTTSGSSGVWRSLAARPLWERKAPGSNPGTPTRRRRPGSSAAATMRVGADPARLSTSLRRFPSEERRRDPQPDPGSARGRGAVRGARAQHQVRLSAHRGAGERSRIPSGQGAPAGHRPAHRAASGPGRGRQRGACPSSTARPSRTTSCARSASRRSTSPTSPTARNSSSPSKSTFGRR